MAQSFIGIDASFNGVPGARTFEAPVATNNDIRATAETLVVTVDDPDRKYAAGNFSPVSNPLETGVYFLGDCRTLFQLPAGGRLCVAVVDCGFPNLANRDPIRDHLIECSDAFVRFSGVFDLVLESIKPLYGCGLPGLAVNLGREYSLTSTRLLTRKLRESSPDMLVFSGGIASFKRPNKFGMPWKLRRANFGEECWIVRSYAFDAVVTRKVLVTSTMIEGGLISTQGLPELAEKDVGSILLSCTDLALLGILLGGNPLYRGELLFTAVKPSVTGCMRLRGFEPFGYPDKPILVSHADCSGNAAVTVGKSILQQVSATRGAFGVHRGLLGFLAMKEPLVAVVGVNGREFVSANRLAADRTELRNTARNALCEQFAGLAQYHAFQWQTLAAEIPISPYPAKVDKEIARLYFERLLVYFETYGVAGTYCKVVQYRVTLAGATDDL